MAKIIKLNDHRQGGREDPITGHWLSDETLAMMAKPEYIVINRYGQALAIFDNRADALRYKLANSAANPEIVVI